MNELTPEQKYSKDGDFKEPVVRCDACQDLILRALLKKVGMCPACSNTRVRNVRMMTQEDFNKVSAWVGEGKIDPDWLKLFEGFEPEDFTPPVDPTPKTPSEIH
jgi:hypothetical protein